MRSRLSAALAAVTVLLGAGLAGSAAVGSASAAEVGVAAAPAGMHRFVVSIGKVATNSRENWNRLGMYTLTDTGEVSEVHWHWTQRERVTRSYTGVTAPNCGARNCNVQTGNGFSSTSAPARLNGTYTVSGSVLRITWSTGIWEEWTVSEPIAGKLAKLTFRGNNFGATHGFGYGSDAAWTTRASMAQIAAADHNSFVHTYYLWKTDSNRVPYIDHATGGPFWYRTFTVCTGGRCAAGNTDKAQYYIARANTTSTDRRDTLWHWFTANADGRGEYCYTGGSHVKPMLEIIDNDGVLHGWVGVEASINTSVPSQGTSGDDIGLFVIADV
jgi:hypothetical protein